MICHDGATGWLLKFAHGQGQGAGRSSSRFYPDSSDPADTLLRNAAGHARDGQWAEAIDMYQRVVQQFGDKVARLPKLDVDAGVAGADPSADFALYVDLRQFCQRKLAELPPEAREIYRSRVDPQAERWLSQGVRDRDRSSLRRVIEQAFCSSFGDDAAETLGDFAYQDGRFEEALSNYRLIVPDRNGDPNVLIHPDPSVDRARIAAKKILCRAASGGKSPAANDLDTFHKQYPEAKGLLAGRDGSLYDTLKAALANDNLTIPDAPDGRWPTFAGSPSRSRVVAGTIDVGSKQWKVDLDPVATNRTGRGAAFPMPPIAPNRLLAYHPIVVSDQVIVTNGSQIIAYNLNDRPEASQGSMAEGVKPAWKFDIDGDLQTVQATRSLAGPPRFTLTALGDRIFARMGPNIVPALNMGRREFGSPSRIVAINRLDLEKPIWPSKAPSDVLVSKNPNDPPSRSIGFEGTPIVDQQGVYVALTDRREETLNYVACLDAETGNTRWIRYLGTAFTDPPNAFAAGMGMGNFGLGASGDFGHRLLTLEGPTLYYQTNLGAVIAIEAETGVIRWVATYPRIDSNGAASDRDLNPAIVHDGLVIVAPDDSASILAFNAETGRLVWKTDAIDDDINLAHLLGVARGNLVATGDRVLLFDVTNGRRVFAWPDAGKTSEGFGRGVLAGDKIYWPTRNEIHVLDQATGLRSDPSIKLLDTYQTTGGNLAVGDGYLIVAQADKLVVFCQNRRLIERYRDEIAKNPNQATSYFLMAQAAEATGQDDLALESLDQALAKADRSDTIDGGSLVDTARDHRFRLLLKMGKKARLVKNLALADRRLDEAARCARLDRDLLVARLTQSEVQLENNAAAESVKTLQTLLQDERLRSLNISAEEERRSIRADLLITDRLGAILSVHGRELYEPFDKQARTVYERAIKDGETRWLDDLTRRFPVAEVVPDALLALGRISLANGRPRDASRASKRLLAIGPNDSYRARALLTLAQSYAQQKLWVPARDVYLQALSRFSDVEVEADDAGSLTKVGPLVEQRLAQPPFDRLVADRAEPNVTVPLARRWTRKLDEASRPITVEGTPPSPEASRILLRQGTTIRSVDLGTGESPWTTDLAALPTWVGYLDDRLIVGSETKIVATSLRDGQTLWQFEAGAPKADPAAAVPFQRPRPPKPAADEEGESGKLHDFQIVAGRIFCLKGDRELIAIDGEGGLIDWSYTSTGSVINPNLLVGPHKTVLQLRGPDSILILETANGRRLDEFVTNAKEEWPRPPLPIDDDHVALVVDRMTVALFDLNKGVDSWRFQQSQEMPKHSPPRLLGDSERLFLIHDGNELIRLDALTGKRTWEILLGVENLSNRPEALAFDGDRVYWMSHQTVSAAKLSDGAIVWRRTVSGPEEGWSIELTSRYVLSYPGLQHKSDNEVERLPLVFRRRSDGALVQRLLFPVPVGNVEIRLMPGGAIVATPSSLWALGEWKGSGLMDVATPKR